VPNWSPAASPVHEPTLTIQQRIRAEGFDAEPSPGESGRMRSLLLIQQNEDSAPQSRFAAG